MKITRSRIVIASLALLALGLYAMLMLTRQKISRSTELATIDAAADPLPVGAEDYDHRLRIAAGQALDSMQLAGQARAAAAAYEQRLDALAEELGAQDWRALFAQLESNHPANREAVLASYRLEIVAQEAFLRPLDLFPWPARGVEVLANDNPIFRRYFSLAMYLEGRLAVTLEPPAEAGHESDLSYLVNHCAICIAPLVAHEVAPGHHIAYSVAAEIIADSAERLVANRTQVVYHEGWALYGEHLMLELGYYQEPAAELAAVRLLYLRALRAAIDPALHRGEITAPEAISIYQRDGGLSAATAQAEVARHLKDPVLKASYFIGLHQILELRRVVLGPQPTPDSLRIFHDRLLGHPRPIPRIARDVFDSKVADFGQGVSPG